MIEFIQKLFSSEGFIPRSICGKWSSDLIHFSIISDGLIWLAYMLIPFMLAILLKKIKIKFAFNWIVWMFVAFIFLCGMTHFMGMVVFFNPLYRLDILIKCLTGIVSILTVVALGWMYLTVEEPPAHLNKILSHFAANVNINKIYYSLAFSVALIIITNILIINNIYKVSNSSQWRAHTFEVLASLEKLNTLFSNAESAERGYCLTNAEYLKTQCVDSLKEIDTQFYKLLDMTQKNDEQIKKIRQMKILADEFKERFPKVMKIRETQGLNATATFLKKSNTLAKKQEIITLQEEIKNIEMNLLTTRTQELSRNITFVVLTTVCASALSLGIIITCFVIMTRQTKTLFKKEEEYRNLLDVTPDAIIGIDVDGVICLANNQAETLFNYGQEELIGKPAEILVPEEDRDAHIQNIKQYLSNPNPTHIGLNLDAVRKNGKSFPVEVNFSPSGSNAIKLLASIRDVTARKELDDKLKKANTELEQFAYVASHDLKAPLRGISNLALWIEEDFSSKIGEEGVKKIDLLRKKTEQMDNLIEGILQYSRIGRVYSDKTQVDLNELVTDVLSELDQKQFAISVAKLPTVTGNKTALSQLFLNLIGNGIKHHTRDDGKIDILVEKNQEYYKFTVKDDGPGIDPKFYDKLFIMFSSLNKEKPGTGIGLALCKKIVEEVGGKIWVESALGKGSKFIFTWPMYLDQ